LELFKFNIALLTYSTKPRGGVVHTLYLAEELYRLGYRVYVYALGSNSEFFRPLNVPYTIIPCPTLPEEGIDDKIERYIDTYFKYLSSHVKDAYDIYHAEDCISANALLKMKQEGLIDFFIRTVHHIDDFTSKRLVECQLKSILEPDYLIAVSRFWEKELSRSYSLRSFVIHNGVDTKKFKVSKVQKERAKRRFRVEDARVVLSIGGIEPRKNTLTSLQAFKTVHGHFKAKGERTVWLIGGGETLFDYRAYRDEFFSQVEKSKLKLGEDIIILGTLSEEDMIKLYYAGDCFIFPSVKEGWGLVVLEALASGLPVVASCIEPLVDYLKDGENALLVSPMDYEALARQIIRVLEKTELRDKLTRNGRETAEIYSWRSTALRHSEFYSRVLESVR